MAFSSCGTRKSGLLPCVPNAPNPHLQEAQCSATSPLLADLPRGPSVPSSLPLLQALAVLMGCVPVVVSDYVMQVGVGERVCVSCGSAVVLCRAHGLYPRGRVRLRHTGVG